MHPMYTGDKKACDAIKEAQAEKFLKLKNKTIPFTSFNLDPPKQNLHE